MQNETIVEVKDNYTIALPPEIAEQHNIKKGSKFYLMENEDLIVLVPQDKRNAWEISNTLEKFRITIIEGKKDDAIQKQVRKLVHLLNEAKSFACIPLPPSGSPPQGGRTGCGEFTFPLQRQLLFIQFKSELRTLWEMCQGSDRYFQQAVVLLKRGSRKAESDRLEDKQLDALLQAVKILEKGELSKEDLSRCDDLLLEAGLDVMIEGDEELLRLYHEDL